MRYETLLSPVKVGTTILKNRLGYPNASPHFLQGPETYPAEPYRAFTANLAKNGAGFITIAAWDNYPQQRKGPADMDMTHMQAFDMSDPAVHNYMSQMCEEVHFYGSKLILTLPISYPEGYTLNGGRAFGPGPQPETQPIPAEKIPEVVKNYVKTARFYRNLGFDGINVRCDMMMNPRPNERTDNYGGSLENRTRILHECFAAVKKALGSGFIITGSVAWEQTNGYGGDYKAGTGYTADDCAAFCHLFDDVIDIYEVREHDGCASHPTGYNFIQGVHPTVDFCARMKGEGIHALMMPLGGFQEPDEMERYLVEGKCDLIGAARAFMADYDYGKKLYEGRGEDITPCLKCNKCHGVILPEPNPWTTVCSVNPLQGLSHKLHRMVEAETTPKKVAVIGGGPAGMRAAIYASERGHQVTLFEATDKLGGQLFHSDYFPFKWPIRNFRDYLVRQLGSHNVDVRMNTRPTPQMIRAGGYDAVIAATGAVVNVPKNIDGIYNENGDLRENVFTWACVCGNEEALGHRVTVVGGSEVGIETAMYLAGLGHEVTVLTRQKRVAHNASGLHYITQAQIIVGEDGIARESAAWLKYPNLHTVTEATTLRVEGTNVVFRKDDAEITLEGDSVVLCGGMTPQTDAALAYAGTAPVFYAIGDCNGAGNLEVCNREAFARAMIL